MARTRNDNKIVNIAVSELRIHPLAQRRIVKSHLQRIVADLDLDAIGTIHVVYYAIQGATTYWVIDGQHRIEALKHHGFDEWKVKAEIHQCHSNSEASALFLHLNRRAAVAAFDLFSNELTAGDETACDIVGICKNAGLKVDRQSRDGAITCVSTLRTVWKIDRGQTLRETISVIVDAVGPRRDAVEGRLIEGLARFLNLHDGEIDRTALVSKLAKYPGGPAALLGNAKGLSKIRSRSLSSCVEEILVDLYNTRRRTRRISDMAAA